MRSNSMLEDIKSRLADNYQEDESVIMQLIEEATAIALSISNRKNNDENIRELSSYIKDYVIAKYLSRGGEGLNSLSEGGTASSFRDLREEMRHNIIRDGKRLLR